MIKIGHVREVGCLKGRYPEPVVTEVRRMAMFLDENYGDDRDVDSDFGGYLLVIETIEDLDRLSDIYLDVDDLIPEYCDVIRTDDVCYTNSLIIINSEYSISLFMRIELTPLSLQAYIQREGEV